MRETLIVLAGISAHWGGGLSEGPKVKLKQCGRGDGRAALLVFEVRMVSKAVIMLKV